MNQIAAQPAFEFVLSILNGKDKGAVYKMLSPRIRIGRAEDNDICLTNDPKISRYHASISVSSNGVEIRDISDKNKLIVDGKEQSMALILPGSIIQLGETKIKFDIDRPANSLAERSDAVSPTFGERSSNRKRKSRRTDSGKLRFYIILGALLLGFAYLLTTETTPKRDPASLKTVENSANQIEKNRETVRTLQETKRKKGLDTEQFAKAEVFYIQGFRDYQKGQYERAKEKFQACLAIFPQHELCGNYFREAQKKLSELIQYYLNLGYEYQSKLQYSSCISAFSNVLYLEKDKLSTIYREADAGREACNEALK